MADHTQYSVVILPLTEKDGGGYMALVPELYGCMADGATREEAVTEVASAILEWIDEATALGRDVPVPGERAQSELKAVKDRQAAADRLIKKQDELIEHLRAELFKATQEINALSEQSKIQFGWDVDYVMAAMDKKKRYASI